MRQGVKTLQVRASTVPEVEPIRGRYREDHEADGPNSKGRSQGLPFFRGAQADGKLAVRRSSRQRDRGSRTYSLRILSNCCASLHGKTSRIVPVDHATHGGPKGQP